jgi:eukaryotic-like serine/threonine-protein kinase
LGLLAYELLTGGRPFTGSGLELEAAIMRGQVPRPSELCEPAVGRALRGDLDTIVLHCLRVEPEQRYRSVEAFADDVDRYLAGRPISARPASTMYRLRKFARRKPWAAPVAAALTLALAGYIATLAAHARTLELERNEAQAQTERAQELQSFLVDLFRVADPYGSPDPTRNREITVVEALDIGAARVRHELGERPLLQAGLLSAIADVYTNLDMREEARPLIEEAMAIRLREGEDRSPEQLDDLGNLMLVAVGPDSAIAIGEHRVALERDVHGRDHPRFAQALLALANPQFQQGRFDEALSHREEAIRILRAAGPSAAGDLADALGLISNSYRLSDRLDDAEEAARAAVEIRERLHGSEHASTATSRVHLALLLSDRQRDPEAIAIYRSVIPVLERTLGPEHFITVNTRNNLGVALSEVGDAAGAEQTYREILEIRRRQAPGGKSQHVAGTLQNLAVAALRQGRRADAEQLIVDAYDMYRDVLPEDHYLVAFPLLTRTEIQLESGNLAGAETSAREARRLLLAGLPAGHYATAVAECRLGSALARQSRLAEAGALIGPALHAIRASAQAPAHFEEECAGYLDAFGQSGGV